MLWRPQIRASIRASSVIQVLTRPFAAARNATETSEEELQLARRWLNKLDAESIPKSVGELSFSRSSGPGGQNVNKVNSKATLKVPLDALLQHVPAALHPQLKSSRFVAPRSNSIVIQADDSRKQSDNAHSCYARLHQLIVEAGRNAIPGETSIEQAKRVKDLQKVDNQQRLNKKKQHSAKKSSRRARGDD
ncbi:hypothetical protein M011DRAFT_402494 [Sporormia fimetaria CBS 119925]|uniref:Prokaryotic-type class I peptide chain release factors domain-containing protein n=1 Tax=Sporormia fimetaria CBS 119925 TaxID=1340428 RepID=A0A6A6VAE1_9PLEO|nr:hypothetical protein M011DRAFT_402494 [Sporormia fimetaria CBS 119925]